MVFPFTEGGRDSGGKTELGGNKNEWGFIYVEFEVPLGFIQME